MIVCCPTVCAAYFISTFSVVTFTDFIFIVGPAVVRRRILPGKSSCVSVSLIAVTTSYFIRRCLHRLKERDIF